MNASAQPLAGLSILLVDDDDDARELAEILLRQVGATVRSASSATEALELFKAATPAIVVADIAMPHRDGVWLLREVRSLPGVPRVPFVAFTALALAHEQQRILAVGFSDVIIKPAEPDDIVRAIVRATTSREPSPPGG
jgi:CheY-like chemotaxis protein